jgi:hypothetical protein
MKHHLFLLFVLAALCSSFSVISLATAPSQYSYIVSLTYASLTQHGPIRLYYKGNRISLNDGFGIIPEAHLPSSFLLVITQEPYAQHASSGVKGIARDKEAAVRCFDVDFISHVDETSALKYRWNCIERSAEDIPLLLPENALIFPFDPALIDTVLFSEEASLPANSESGQGNHVVRLPSIALRDTTTQKEFNQACDYAALVSPDLESVHSPIKSAVSDNITLCLFKRGAAC